MKNITIKTDKMMTATSFFFLANFVADGMICDVILKMKYPNTVPRVFAMISFISVARYVRICKISMDSDIPKPKSKVSARRLYFFQRKGSITPKGRNRKILRMVFLMSAIIGKNGISVTDSSNRINCNVGIPTNK